MERLQKVEWGQSTHLSHAHEQHLRHGQSMQNEVGCHDFYQLTTVDKTQRDDGTLRKTSDR